MPRKKKIEIDGNSDLYNVSLTIGEEKYEAEGETVLDALLQINPPKVCYKGLLKVIKGARKAEKMFYVTPLRRLFMGKVPRIMWAKYMTQALK